MPTKNRAFVSKALAEREKMWLLISEFKSKWSRQVSLPCQCELTQRGPQRIKQAMIAPGKTKAGRVQKGPQRIPYEVAYPLPPAEPFIVLLFLGGLDGSLD